MTRIKLEYVHEYRDRHGKVRRYVRRREFELFRCPASRAPPSLWPLIMRHSRALRSGPAPSSPLARSQR